jgi:DNA repair protein RecO (recombination protein O)
MAPIIKTEAIVLRTRNLRDSSKIAVTFSEQYGKLDSVARGVRRTKSRFGASLEPLTHCYLVIYHRRDRTLHTISEATIIHSFQHLRSWLPGISYGSAVIESLDRSTGSEDPNRHLFDLAVKTLEEMDASESEAALATIFWAYLLRLLGLVGYAPRLRKCVVCGSTAEPSGFDIPKGGMLCPRCAPLSDYSLAINDTLRAFVLRLQSAPLAELRLKPARSTALSEVSLLIDRFFSFHLGGPAILNALEFHRRTIGTAPPNCPGAT